MALAIDPSTPATLAGTGNSAVTTLASNSFTPPNNSVVFVFASDGNNAIAVSGMSGGGLTWTRRAQSIQTGKASMEVWYAPVTTSPGSMQVTVTFASASENQARMISVVVFTGAATDQSTGHTATQQSLSVPSATLAAAASSSWVIGAVHNWDGGNPTVPASQTTTINGISQVVTTASGDSAWMQANTAAGNSNLTINDTAPSCNHAMTAVEVLAAAGGTNASVTAVPMVAAPKLPAPGVSAGSNASVTAPPMVAAPKLPAPGARVDAAVTAPPMRAAAVLPEAGVPISVGVVAPPITAALSMVAPAVSTGSNVSLTAPPMRAAPRLPTPATSVGGAITAPPMRAAPSLRAPGIKVDAAVLAAVMRAAPSLRAPSVATTGNAAITAVPMVLTARLRAPGVSNGAKILPEIDQPTSLPLKTKVASISFKTKVAAAAVDTKTASVKVDTKTAAVNLDA